MLVRSLLTFVFCLLLAGCTAAGNTGQPVVIVVTATPPPAAPGAGTGAQPTQPAAQALPAATLPPANQAVPTNTVPPANAAPANTVPAVPNPTFTPAGAATLAGAGAVPATGPLPPVSFDQLMDFSVVDASGNLLGEVQDAAIERGAANAATGQIAYLVVDSNLKNDWNIPVPWQFVTIRPELMAVMLPVNATQLAAAPGFNDELWPANLTGQNNVVQNFWANPGQAAGIAPVLPGGLSASYLRASDVAGVDILSPQGIKLGEIQDIAVDWKNSQAGAQAAQFSYLVMEMNDDLGFENRMIPIPWRLVRINPGQENAIVNMAQTQVLNAPNFLQGGMPDLYSEPLLSQLRQFWPQ